MAVVPRKTKDGVVYRVAILHNGKQYWEAAGSDRREADRLDARRKREVANGQYVPPQARSDGTTIRSYAERFFDARTNRNAESERTQVERHALSLDWFGSLRMEDARPPHFLRLVKELRAKTREADGGRLLSEKSIANVVGTLRTMFGEAHFNEVIVGNPCVLPRKTLKRRSKARAPYTGREVLALMSDKVDITRRVFVWLAFYTGMREGEICGRRWRDWNRDSRPLGALLCSSQYDDRPLKGDEEGGDARPRVVPVHPALAKVLNEWRTTGFEIVHGRRPDDDDFHRADQERGRNEPHSVERLQALAQGLRRGGRHQPLAALDAAHFHDLRPAGHPADRCGRGHHPQQAGGDGRLLQPLALDPALRGHGGAQLPGRF